MSAIESILPPGIPTPQAWAVEIHRRLLTYFGLPTWGKPQPALDELISTILSQNTNDTNRDRAFQELRRRFPDWEAVRVAPSAEVIDAIRSAGLANQKGPRIQAILEEIRREVGSLGLEGYLRSLPVEEARRWLGHFKGVGPKTTAIVLLFSLGIPAFPVDTHIYRVSGRIGIRPEKMTVEQAHVYLEGLFPPETYGPAHLNLIRLGRQVCHPRHPDCPLCPALQVCWYGRRRMEDPKAG